MSLVGDKAIGWLEALEPGKNLDVNAPWELQVVSIGEEYYCVYSELVTCFSAALNDHAWTGGERAWERFRAHQQEGEREGL
ncbi:MAG: hypothetical protein SGPRY_006663 [Prymnesium sp.]